jgi:hypothetical protein
MPTPVSSRPLYSVVGNVTSLFPPVTTFPRSESEPDQTLSNMLPFSGLWSGLKSQRPWVTAASHQNQNLFFFLTLLPSIYYRETIVFSPLRSPVRPPYASYKPASRRMINLEIYGAKLALLSNDQTLSICLRSPVGDVPLRSLLVLVVLDLSV